MRVHPARVATLGFGAAILVWMALLQFVLTPHITAPWPIFLLFVVGWGTVVALVVKEPRLGGIFAALLGIAGAFGALQTHRNALDWTNVVLAALSVGAGVAGAVLAAKSRENDSVR